MKQLRNARGGGTGGERISDGFGSETHLEVLILLTDQADGGYRRGADLVMQGGAGEQCATELLEAIYFNK
jgi:hypothetical protein